MRVRPVRLNATVAWLFILGSTCFVVGSIPAYVNAVGGWPDGVTYFVGSLFFTAASAGRLLQAQSAHDRNWWAAVTQLPGTVFFNVSTFAALAHNATVAETNRYVWRPDFYGSTLFLVASGFGIAAVAGSRALPWRIAWLNMIGSILFMASALASYVLPTGELVSTRVSVVGTLLGAACFLLGAALMLPARRHAVSSAPASPTDSTRTVPQNVQPKETP